ncbi:uncharacterized protein DEA37_0001947 [Paragonimus westermani]|uniref:Transcription and mRNA export factor ENY2 n=1 Tax=Paragonimus westermani TaxID=34504 RepID=A0A5J4N6K1_9TREM|nr:uncharacterized protein DEA37_0001947 [Paragonimus westermani]
MTEKRAEIKSKIADLLVKTGERERLREFVENRLTETGWNDKVKQACKEYIRTKGVDNITVEEVVQAITPLARQIVPVEVRQDVLEQLRKFLVQHDIDVQLNDHKASTPFRYNGEWKISPQPAANIVVDCQVGGASFRTLVRIPQRGEVRSKACRDRIKNNVHDRMSHRSTGSDQRVRQCGRNTTRSEAWFSQHLEEHLDTMLEYGQGQHWVDGGQQEQPDDPSRNEIGQTDDEWQAENPPIEGTDHT